MPLAPRNEVDLVVGVAAVAHHPRSGSRRSCTRTIRTPSRWRRWRCRSARPTAAARWWRRAASTSTCSGIRSRRWKYRQVDLFIAASEAIRDDPRARRHRRRSHRRRARRHRRRQDRAAAGARHARRVLVAARRAGRWSTSARWSAHKGQKYPASTRCRTCCARCPTRSCVIFGEGELRAPLEQQIRELRPREARRAGRAFARTCCS